MPFLVQCVIDSVFFPFTVFVFTSVVVSMPLDTFITIFFYCFHTHLTSFKSILIPFVGLRIVAAYGLASAHPECQQRVPKPFERYGTGDSKMPGYCIKVPFLTITI